MAGLGFALAGAVGGLGSGMASWADRMIQEAEAARERAWREEQNQLDREYGFDRMARANAYEVEGFERRASREDSLLAGERAREDSRIDRAASALAAPGRPLEEIVGDMTPEERAQAEETWNARNDELRRTMADPNQSPEAREGAARVLNQRLGSPISERLDLTDLGWDTTEDGTQVYRGTDRATGRRIEIPGESGETLTAPASSADEKLRSVSRGVIADIQSYVETNPDIPYDDQMRTSRAIATEVERLMNEDRGLTEQQALSRAMDALNVAPVTEMTEERGGLFGLGRTREVESTVGTDVGFVYDQPPATNGLGTPPAAREASPAAQEAAPVMDEPPRVPTVEDVSRMSLDDLAAVPVESITDQAVIDALYARYQELNDRG